jgi:hypothetical protein
VTAAQAAEAALRELECAREKWPAGFHSGHEGYAVLKEELEELWEAVKSDDTAHARREAVQIAAMALRYLTDLP